MDWLTLTIFIPVHTGFAGLFGIALRKSSWRLSILSLILVGVSPLMLPGWMPLIFWGYAAIFIYLFLHYSSKLPTKFWLFPLNYRFWGMIMILIALWGMMHAQWILGSAAILAACTALTKSIK